MWFSQILSQQPERLLSWLCGLWLFCFKLQSVVCHAQRSAAAESKGRASLRFLPKRIFKVVIPMAVYYLFYLYMGLYQSGLTDPKTFWMPADGFFPVLPSGIPTSG